jgi:hypothetical protein
MTDNFLSRPLYGLRNSNDSGHSNSMDGDED